MAHQIYDEFLKQLLTGDINLNTADEVKVILCSELPPVGSTDYMQIVASPYQIANTAGTLATEYIAGGLALQNVVIAEGASSITFNADDITWNSNTDIIQAKCAVLYHNNSSNATRAKPLMMCFDFGENKTVAANENFVIEWNNTTNSIFEISS